MSGRRVLDAITFLNASRNVAAKHIALQRRTLDLHARTSFITKEAKSHADRIGLAVKAASDLARKLDEPSPPSAGPQNAAAPPAGNHVFEEALNSHEVQGDSGGNNRKADSESTQSNTVDNIATKSSGVIHGESASVSPGKNGTITATTGENASDKQEEISGVMMGQLFRSPKVSNSLFRDRMSGARTQGSERDADAAPLEADPPVFENVDNSSTEGKIGHLVTDNKSTPIPSAPIDQSVSETSIDTTDQRTRSTLSQQVSYLLRNQLCGKSAK